MSGGRTKRHRDAQARFSRGRTPRRPARLGPRSQASEATVLPPDVPDVSAKAGKPEKPSGTFPWGIFALVVLLLLAAGLYRDLNTAQDAVRQLVLDPVVLLHHGGALGHYAHAPFSGSADRLQVVLPVMRTF